MSSSGQLTVGSAREDGTVILSPRGDIDINSSPVLAGVLRTTQAEQGVSRLIIDLTGVPYMDSSGVATLVQAVKTGSKKQMTIVLAGPQSRVQSIFQIARLDTFFRIVPDVDTARTA